MWLQATTTLQLAEMVLSGFAEESLRRLHPGARNALRTAKNPPGFLPDGLRRQETIRSIPIPRCAPDPARTFLLFSAG